MATITKEKYKEGHQIILKDGLSSIVAKAFIGEKYAPGKEIFSLVRNVPKNKDIKIIDLKSGSDSVFVKDVRGNIVQLIASTTMLNSIFNHHSKTSKSNTTFLTEIKEVISLNIFKIFVESGTIPDEEYVMGQLPKTYLDYYDTSYYKSSVLQARQLKSWIGSSKGYVYERQNGPLSKPIYGLASKLTSKNKDNWNPGDVWMFKNGGKLYDQIIKSVTSKQLNELMGQAIAMKEIIPISLKNITGNKANLSLVNPSDVDIQKINMDFSIDSNNLSPSFNNFIIFTRSSFGVRVGYKASADNYNVYLEGRYKGAGSNIGAVDAKEYVKFLEQKQYKLEKGIPDLSRLNAAKDMFSKLYSNPSNKITSTAYRNLQEIIEAVDKADEFTKKRFINLVSYLGSFYVGDFKQHMLFCYLSAKKLSGNSSPYILIS